MSGRTTARCGDSQPVLLRRQPLHVVVPPEVRVPLRRRGIDAGLGTHRAVSNLPDTKHNASNQVIDRSQVPALTYIVKTKAALSNGGQMLD